MTVHMFCHIPAEINDPPAQAAYFVYGGLHWTLARLCEIYARAMAAYPLLWDALIGIGRPAPKIQAPAGISHLTVRTGLHFILTTVFPYGQMQAFLRFHNKPTSKDN